MCGVMADVMPRPIRIQYPWAIYHVMSGGSFKERERETPYLNEAHPEAPATSGQSRGNEKPK